jgi:hypothetical protein
LLERSARRLKRLKRWFLRSISILKASEIEDVEQQSRMRR